MRGFQPSLFPQLVTAVVNHSALVFLIYRAYRIYDDCVAGRSLVLLVNCYRNRTLFVVVEELLDG